MIIGNEEVIWTTSVDLGVDTIQAKDTAFDRSKSKKKHARQVIKCEKFFGVDKSLLEALKEKYAGYECRMSYEMVCTKISNVTKKHIVQLKKAFFTPWEQPQVLSAYIKQIEKARKQLQKWSVNVPDNDIVIYVVDQMYESDWFSEDTMTKWEETNDNKKTWKQC